MVSCWVSATCQIANNSHQIHFLAMSMKSNNDRTSLKLQNSNIAIRSADAYPLASPWDMKHCVVEPLSLFLITH
jgi:hypothetical protein